MGATPTETATLRTAWLAYINGLCGAFDPRELKAQQNYDRSR